MTDKKLFSKLYLVERKTKSDPSRTYIALIASLPYRDIILSFDRNSIAEILSVSVSSLYDMVKDNGSVCVGEIGLA